MLQPFCVGSWNGATSSTKIWNIWLHQRNNLSFYNYIEFLCSKDMMTSSICSIHRIFRKDLLHSKSYMWIMLDVIIRYECILVKHGSQLKESECLRYRTCFQLLDLRTHLSKWSFNFLEDYLLQLTCLSWTIVYKFYLGWIQFCNISFQLYFHGEPIFLSILLFLTSLPMWSDLKLKEQLSQLSSVL